MRGRPLIVVDVGGAGLTQGFLGRGVEVEDVGLVAVIAAAHVPVPVVVHGGDDEDRQGDEIQDQDFCGDEVLGEQPWVLGKIAGTVGAED